MRELNWGSTPLGDPECWPQSLRATVRMLLTSRYQMWMGWGPELAFLYNDAYRPTMGVKHPWGLAKPAATVWKEIWSDIGPLIDQVLTTGEAIFSEGLLLLLERSGFPEETYHTFSYSPLFDDDGTVAGMFCVVMEETERVLNERRLATLRELATAAAGTKEEGELFSAVESTLGRNLKDLPFTLTYRFDEDQETARLVAATGIQPGAPGAPPQIQVSDGIWPVAALLGNAPAVVVEDLEGRFGPMPSGAWDKPPSQALVAPIAQQAHDRSAAGFFVVGLNPYRKGDENLTGFIGLLAGQIGSALATVRAYEEERRRAEALAEIDRAKTAFFSNVSHEFRTPLTLLLGPLEELLATTSSDVQPQIQLAHRNGMRLLRLVNSLLDFARIEAGRVQAAYVPTDLAQLSAEIASSFRAAIEKAGLTLAIRTEPIGQHVYVDREMWEKVLLNLLSNAFKFTFEGEIAVAVEPGGDGRSAIVRVSDTGIGIPDTELPRLFERFHRVEGAQGRSFEGSGIGLALVQELVKLHGGDIAVESELGRGTAFTIRLPTGSAHLPAERVRDSTDVSGSSITQPFVEEALRWLPEAESGPIRPGEDSLASEPGLDLAGAGTGKRVLVADDNADMRDYVSRLLRAEGFEVESAADGEAALSSAKKRTPDLILSDVMMPKLDGFGLLRGVRDDPNLGGVPVILLSARAGEEAKVEGLEAGADDYLVKPFAARELLARVNANIQMAALRREAERAIVASEQRYMMTQERLSMALSTGRVAVFEWEVDSDHLAIQGPMAEVFGVPMEDAQRGLPLAAFLEGIEPEDLGSTLAILNTSVETGSPYEAEYRTHGSGDQRTVLARGMVETAADGKKRMAGVLIDLTEERQAEQEIRAKQAALEEETRALQILNRAASAIAGDLDVQRLAQTITDAGVELTGAEAGAFFYNDSEEKNAGYQHRAMSGPSRDALEELPPDIVAPALSGESLVRSDDWSVDGGGGSEAVQVRSYLAVPVRSRTDDVIGALVFGHSQPAKFDARAEDLILGLASQAAVVMDNARLFLAAQRELSRRRLAEEQLQILNAGLEERVASEVAQRTAAEDALRQAQKMEAVGQLTGGVAHDFNNLLTVIIGGLDTIRRHGSDDSRIERAVSMALQGAERAASLTRRLLAFSRRQPLEPQPLKLNSLVRDMTDLLHRTLGEQIELEGVLAPRLWTIEVDRNQLESAIVNLAVNARDAMPEGGKLTIETANTILDEGYAATDSEVVPGQYVVVAVSDTGVGMSDETLGRVFEPFFTTKEVGRGTGLGLSMIYGFVKQSGGHVTIYSEEGQGSTVKLYFPRYFGEASAGEETQSHSAPGGSSDEVILVVEDNEDVRAYSVNILTELGYNVLQAADADSALEILRSDQRIDLLFTDVVLPGKSGRVLADAAWELRPELKVLFTTGYSRNAIVHHGRLDPGVQLISKPFTFDQLANRVRDLLDHIEHKQRAD